MSKIDEPKSVTSESEEGVGSETPLDRPFTKEDKIRLGRNIRTIVMRSF